MRQMRFQICRSIRWPSAACILALLGANLGSGTARADDWPQWLGPQRDGIWREKGILEKFPATGLKELWRVPIGGGYSGPAVANGRVYLTDWVLPPGGKFPANPFAKTEVTGKERVLCVDEKSGKVLWQQGYPCVYNISYAAGPRCTPLVAGNRVYTLGAMGNLLCLDIENGHVVWSKDFVKDYQAPPQLWGFAGHPLLDGKRLICLVGGPGSLIVAFDKDNGKELWKAITVEEQGYVPPIIHEIGGKRQLITWHPEGLHGLNPENGDVYWQWKYAKPAKVGLVVSTPRVDGNKIFVTAFYDGPLMLELDKNGLNPKVLWQGKSKSEMPDRTDGLHSIMPTPFIKEGHIYGVCSYGELRCLKEVNGERLWMTRQPTANGQELRWANAFLVQHEKEFFLFNELGDLILADLSPKGYKEISRANILPPTNTMAGPKGRKVVWSHPAFANQHIYARNDQHLVCVSLAKKM
jgi:outer membrane protein assembly factor BamB